MTGGGLRRHWRTLLVSILGVVSLGLVALALIAPAPPPGDWSAPRIAAVSTPAVAADVKPSSVLPVGETGGTGAAGKTRVPVFRRGVNLSRQQSFSRSDPARPGHYLWPPFDGDLAGMSDAELDRLTRLGFDFVRLPVDAGPFLAAGESDERLLLDGLRHWVTRLRTHGLSVLLDIHPATYSSQWRPKDILADPRGEKFARYRSFLETVARLLADQPAGSFALELMNEPQPDCVRDDGEDWTVSQRSLFAAVRAVAPSMPVVLTGGCWSSVDGLVRLDPAAFDDATLYDFHFYEPYFFTHQSLPWAAPPARHIAGLSYPAANGTIAGTLELTKAHLARLAQKGTPQPADALDAAAREISYYYRTKKPGPATTDSRFATVSAWAQQHGIAPERIVVGEFSAIRWPDGVADDGSRLRWIRDVRETAERHGFGWALWDYTNGFGLLADNASRTVDKGTAEALGLDTGALRQ